MKLTQEQVQEIYLYISVGFSQRQVARKLRHGRHTIAHYLKPQVVTEEYRELIHGVREVEYERDEAVSVATFYMKVSIILGIAFILQTLITIFY